MPAIPNWALVHTITLERFAGRNATGPVYGDPVEHRCLLSETRNLAREGKGRQRTTTVSIHLAPGVDVPLDSRVTARGQSWVVTAVAIRDGGGLPTPDHVAVTCELGGGG